MSKKRLRNYGLWTALASFSLLIARKFGFEMPLEDFNEIIDMGLGILVLLGIISNPTKPDGKGFNL